MTNTEIALYSPESEIDFSSRDLLIKSLKQQEIELGLYFRRCGLTADQTNLFSDMDAYDLARYLDYLNMKFSITKIPCRLFTP